MNVTKHPNVHNSGNANFLFSEEFVTMKTVLVVNSSLFVYGKNDHTAGGLNLHIHCTNIHVIIVNITAQGNIGHYGGNLALYLITFTVNSSSIVINNSRITDGRAKKGAGLRFWSKQNQNSEESIPHIVHHTLHISKSLFKDNFAYSTGGAIYMSYDNVGTNTSLGSVGGTVRQVTIRNCNFTTNGGDGAAMEIIQFSHYITPLAQTSVENCIFENNFTPFYFIGPVLDLISVEVSVTNCTFTGSNTTAISLRNSYLKVFGDILFENNTASTGGALKLLLV